MSPDDQLIEHYSHIKSILTKLIFVPVAFSIQYPAKMYQVQSAWKYFRLQMVSNNYDTYWKFWDGIHNLEVYVTHSLETMNMTGNKAMSGANLEKMSVSGSEAVNKAMGEAILEIMSVTDSEAVNKAMAGLP